MLIVFIIVCMVIVFSLNTKGDAMHRENAEAMQQIDNPAASAWHTANGCTGVLMWIGFVVLGVTLLGLLGVDTGM